MSTMTRLDKIRCMSQFFFISQCFRKQELIGEDPQRGIFFFLKIAKRTLLRYLLG